MRVASALVTVSKIIAAGTAMILNAYLARQLLVSEYGFYSVWLAYINLAGLVLICGLNVSHIYHYKMGEDHFIKIIKSYGVLIALCYGLALVSDSIIMYIGTGAIAIACISIINADAQAQERHTLFSLQVICQSLFVPIGLVAAVFLLGEKSAAIIIKTYATCLLVFLCAILLYRYWSETPRVPAKLNRDFFSYGIKNFFINLFGQLLYSADIFIVSFFMSKRSVAYYSVSALVAKSLWLVTDAIGLVVFPKLIGKSEPEKVKIVNDAIKFAAIVCLIPSVVFFAFGFYILKLAFGADYGNSFVSASILVVASFPLIYYKIGSRMAAASQRWKDVYVSLTAAVGINLILCFILIPTFGIEGAAVASLLAYGICGAYLAKRLNLITRVRLNG